jgi:hypothetical protein
VGSARRTALVAIFAATPVACSSRVAPGDAHDADAALIDTSVDTSVDSLDVVDTPAPPVDVAPPPVDAGPTPSCAALQPTCATAPQQLVRAHANGLVGVDGATVQFGVRYLLVTGMGLDAPRGTAAGRGIVSGGAFEVCVCVPSGSNNYPVEAAVVFMPGAPPLASRDVVLDFVSQRFAALPDEDLGMVLHAPASAVETEVALADTVVRNETVAVHGLDASLASTHVFAGLIASNRPIAPQLATATIASGSVSLQWDGPGVAWPDESLYLLVDVNGDGMCNNGDDGAIVALGGRTDIPSIGTAWLQGAALAPVCNALLVGTSRTF